MFVVSVPQVARPHSSSYFLWSLLTVGETGPMPCEDFLGRDGASVQEGELILCLWKDNAAPSCVLWG